MQGVPELDVLTHAAAVSPDADDMAVVEQAVDQGACHDVVSEHLAPLLEALVGGEDRGSALVAAGHQLVEEHGAGGRDGEVADLVDDEDGWKGQGLEPVGEATAGLSLLEGGDHGQGLHGRKAARTHGGLEPPVVAELDLGAEEGLDGLGGSRLAAVDAGEHRVEGLQSAWHLEVGELASDPVPAGPLGGLHRTPPVRAA